MVESAHTAGWWPSLYEPFRNAGEKLAEWFAPRSDASALEDAYEITLELPGVDMEDVDVSIRDNTLVVKGEKRSEHEEKGKSYYFSERQYGAFQRSFRLPADADAGNVDAEYRDGVLRLRIGKHKPSEPEPQKITIKKA